MESDEIILVADDDPVVLQVMEAALRRAGYKNLRCATDGLQVLEMVEERQPRLIIMDIMMPRMDGLVALRTLKENPATSEVPVIIATGKALDTLRPGDESKAQCVLHKPFEVDRLLDEVKALLRGSRAVFEPVEQRIAS